MRRRRIHRGAPSSVDPESIRMHFIVLGAGAIGCYVGGRLAAHGQPVCLVGRPHALEPIALHGLKVTDLDGFDRTVPVSALQLAHTLADAAPGPDSIILLCVKSGATESAARELADACAPGTPVISLQNGVDNVARVTARAPGLSVLAGMVPYNEVLRVMARAGIAPAQVTAVSPTLLPHVLRLPNWLFTRLAKRMLQIDAKARSSMWDDLEAGRVTEIDALSG